MSDVRPTIAEQTAALARLHNARGDDWCYPCDEPAPCRASLMLGDADDRLTRRLAAHPTEDG